MDIFLILVLATLSRAEMCVRFLKNKEEFNAVLRIPGRIWRWNVVTKKFEQLEALKENGSAVCSVERNNDIDGKTIVVAVDMMPPYVVAGPNDSVTGYIGDIWTILGESLKFKTIYRRIGSTTDRSLMNGNADAVLAATAIHSYTAGHYTYSTPVATNSYALFVLSEGNAVSKFWYLSIFAPHLWMTIVIFTICLSATFMGMYSYKKAVCKHDVECDDEFIAPSFNLLCVIGVISGQGFQKLPSSWSLRLLALFSLLMGMLLSCGFSSTLTSYLAITGSTLPLTNLQDVAKKRTHSLCIRNDSTAYTHFTENGSPVGEVQTIWKNLVNKGCPDMRNRSKLASRLCRSGFAYLEAPDVFFSVYRKVQHQCDVVQIPGKYWRLKMAILHARAAHYRYLIDYYILRLRSTGILKYLEKKWISTELTRPRQHWGSFRPVEYAHIHLISLCLLAMFLISALICLLENIWFDLRKRLRKRRNLKCNKKSKIKVERVILRTRGGNDRKLLSISHR